MVDLKTCALLIAAALFSVAAEFLVHYHYTHYDPLLSTSNVGYMTD